MIKISKARIKQIATKMRKNNHFCIYYSKNRKLFYTTSLFQTDTLIYEANYDTLHTTTINELVDIIYDNVEKMSIGN